jgi:hypothetical protein
MGDVSTATGTYSTAIGFNADSTAQGAVTIGHQADNASLYCITLAANDVAETTKPTLSQTAESIVCYARNLDAYDGAFRIVAGDDLALQECSVADHNSTLTWTYTPTTTGDWAGADPTNIGQALDRLAAAYTASHSAVP